MIFGKSSKQPEKVTVLPEFGELQLMDGTWFGKVDTKQFDKLTVSFDTDGEDVDDSSVKLLQEILSKISELHARTSEYYDKEIIDESKEMCGALKFDAITICADDYTQDFHLEFNCCDWEDGFLSVIFKDFQIMSYYFAD
jgi:hypothetical protein